LANVLVTGGTGFIGRRLVRALLARGDDVRCLVRPGRKPPPDTRSAPGDVTRPESLPAALKGVEVVYHLAGATTVRHPVEYRRVNAQGTRHLAEACAGLPRPPLVVFLSSLAAAGPAVGDRPRDERDPPAPVSRYGHSKLAAECWLAAVSGRVPATVVRAPAVFGPGDTNTIRLFRAAAMGLNGVPGSASVRLAWIHVDDLARALVAAGERGEWLSAQDPARGVYFAALEEQPTLAEVADLAAAAVGRARVKTFALPRGFCWFWGHVIDFWVSLTGKPRLLTTDKMREVLAGSWTCRTDKALRELDFRCQVGLAEGFAGTVAWYREHGWL
jgi:nucleoside-diphosphate-sugar epimerase